MTWGRCIPSIPTHAFGVLLVNFARSTLSPEYMNRDMPTEWLKIMLEEIERRREDTRRGREEESRRSKPVGDATPTRAEAPKHTS